MSTRVVAIVQARMGSSRLPGKSLMAIGGRPMLTHVLERVAATSGVDETVLATSTHARDDGLLAVAASLGLRTWRGSERDVLGRVRDAAWMAKADVVLRATADCPLFCTDIAEEVLELYRSTIAPSGYCWNDTTASGYPDGTDVEVFSVDLLHRACVDAGSMLDREHVTPPIRRLAPRLGGVQASIDWRHVKLSVDRPVEFQIVAQVAARIPRGDYSWKAVADACRQVGLVKEAT